MEFREYNTIRRKSGLMLKKKLTLKFCTTVKKQNGTTEFSLFVSNNTIFILILNLNLCKVWRMSKHILQKMSQRNSFLVGLSKFAGVSKNIEIQNKTYTIENKELWNIVIFNFELYHSKTIYLNNYNNEKYSES